MLGVGWLVLICGALSLCEELFVEAQGIGVIGWVGRGGCGCSCGVGAAVTVLKRGIDRRREKNMKVAISASGSDMSSRVDARFGRAPWFVIADTESGAWKAVENSQNVQAAQGAGIQSAERVVGEGVDATLTGHCGPNAFRALLAAGVKVFVEVEGSVEEALDALKGGTLKAAEDPDVEGHWA